MRGSNPRPHDYESGALPAVLIQPVGPPHAGWDMGWPSGEKREKRKLRRRGAGGPSGGIRTRGLVVPNHARYRASPRPGRWAGCRAVSSGPSCSRGCRVVRGRLPRLRPVSMAPPDGACMPAFGLARPAYPAALPCPVRRYRSGGGPRRPGICHGAVFSASGRLFVVRRLPGRRWWRRGESNPCPKQVCHGFLHG